MKYFLSVVSLAALTYSSPQLSFGSNDPNPRLGLLASNLGLNPTGGLEERTGSLEELPLGRVPGAPTVGAEATASVHTSGQVRLLTRTTLSDIAHSLQSRILPLLSRISVAVSPLSKTALICMLFRTSWARDSLTPDKVQS